jgi:hypothetical protein
METVECRAAKYHMVRALKGYHLKGYRLFAEIFFIGKGYLESDGSQRFRLATRNHSIKSDNTMAELGLGEAKFGERFGVHDFQAAATIHKALGELIALDQRVDYHGIVSIWDVL